MKRFFYTAAVILSFLFGTVQLYCINNNVKIPDGYGLVYIFRYLTGWRSYDVIDVSVNDSIKVRIPDGCYSSLYLKPGKTTFFSPQLMYGKRLDIDIETNKVYYILLEIVWDKLVLLPPERGEIEIRGSFPLGGEESSAFNLPGVFTVNDQLFVNGKHEARQITSGERHDFTPSWSPDGKWIAFYRVMDNFGPDNTKWKTSVCIMKPDGSGFRQLTGGNYTDFDPTWSREGSNFIIFNRFDRQKWRWYIYRTAPESKAGDEALISDPDYSETGYTSLKDGRIIISSIRGDDAVRAYLFSSSPENDGYYRPPYMYFLTPYQGRKGRYEPVKFKYKLEALPAHLTLSQDESLITYELDFSFGAQGIWEAGFNTAGRSLALADIDTQAGTVSNSIIYAKSDVSIILMPSFVKDGKGIIYQSNKGGVFEWNYQLMYYDLKTRETKNIPRHLGSSYKSFCEESAPR